MMLAQALKMSVRGALPQAPAVYAPVMSLVHNTASFFSTTASSTASSSQKVETESTVPKLLVFGGRGYVGSAICKEAVKCGLQVLSISPSGTPPVTQESWVDQVQWRRGNALEPRSYEQHLEGALAAVSCVGAFGSNEYMLKVNGEANSKAIQAAAAAGVPRFVFVSAYVPNLPVVDTLIKGYIQGKQQAEEALFTHYPKTGVCLRPSFIYGTRTISKSLSVPLQAFGEPWKALLGYVPQSKQFANIPFIGALVVPPVSVESVAQAALHGATDPSVAGVVDVWDIAKYGSK